MALGKRRYRESVKSELSGFGAVRATRGLGRKRIGISKEDDSCCLKRRCSDKFKVVVSDDCDVSSSPLEALPQELLVKFQFSIFVVCFGFGICSILNFGDFQIRILCGVEHDDLKQLMLVSKSVKEAVSV